jgi:malonyl-CoA/methylmalonyl-CoA synthetase
MQAVMLPRFDASRVFERLAEVDCFMGVPTMYHRLLETYDQASASEREPLAERVRGLGLATSGSAALPVTLAERWQQIAGSIPLERYGMTEIGVGCSNPLEPAERRRGWVGRPLPTLATRIVDDDGRVSEQGPGMLQVKGPSVFEGYWRRPEATAEAFDDGWFITGDIAQRDEAGFVKLLGRRSVDIIKSGGYKLSALEIEEHLRDHEAVAEVAVVGLPDAVYGQRVAAVIVPRTGRADRCTEARLRPWLEERIARHKVPREWVLREELPKNALGKVLKPALANSLADALASRGRST